jgi:hypothetical protein
MTILFAEDFEKKHPSAIVDYKTRNESFVRLAAVYNKMGVPHASRMILALHNRDLQGIDPFNPPDAETALAISLECKDNFWYFIREIARDPAGSEDFPILFNPNRGVISAYWLYLNHIVFFLIMIRQTGKSFGIDWLYIWLLNCGTTKYEIAQLTKDEKLRGRELERLKAMELTLPSYLKLRHDRDPGNTETLRVSRLENHFKSYLPNKSPKIADMVGRGMTASTAGVDELAYIFNNFITVPVMLSATQAAREVSRMKNEPYGTIFTTTSGKRDTPEGRYAYRLVHSGAVWSEQFMNCQNLAELEKVILTAAPGDERGDKRLYVNCTFNHRQLGKSDEWLRQRLKDSMQEDPIQVQADYFNMWPSGTSSSPFSKEIAEAIRNSLVEDYYTAIEGDDMYALRWYYDQNDIDHKLKSVPHVLTLDSSDAVGRDAMGVNLINLHTGEEAMAATVPKTNLISFSKWICEFMVKHTNVTLIPERRGSGQTIIDYLLLYLPSVGIDPFTRIYNLVVQEADEYPERFKEIQNPFSSNDNIYNKYKKCFGWATSGSGATSRSDLYSKTLNVATRLGSHVVRDNILILQLLGLVIKNGRVDHQDGEHDDMCFVGDTLVRTIDGNRPIKDIKVGDLVLTRKGYRPVLKLYSREKEVISKFGMRGTPEHPFITPHGEIPLRDLTETTEVYTWNEKLSTIEVKTITDILSLQDLSIETTTGDTTSTRNRPLLFIDRFTRMSTDLFQQGILSTIKTVTSSITHLKTWNASPKPSTSDDTLCQKRNAREDGSVRKTAVSWLSGVMRTLILPERAPSSTERRAQLSLTGVETTLSSLDRTQSRLLSEAPKLEGGKERVYNLMVAECHEYFVNDILVHNCVSWLLGWWFMTNGKNLSYYGIDSRFILSDNVAVVQEKKSISMYDRYRQEEARRKVEYLQRMIEEEKDTYLLRRYEAELERSISTMTEEDRKIIAADDLLQQLRDKRNASLEPRMNSQASQYLQSALSNYPSSSRFSSSYSPYGVQSFSRDQYY